MILWLLTGHREFLGNTPDFTKEIEDAGHDTFSLGEWLPKAKNLLLEVNCDTLKS